MKKMDLKKLKVKSFVTAFEHSSSDTIKGGAITDICLTNAVSCVTCVSDCFGGGGGGASGGACPSIGCSNNSCFECHAE